MVPNEAIINANLLRYYNTLLQILLRYYNALVIIKGVIMGKSALIRKRLDSKSKALRSNLVPVPNFGWVRNVREALGMTQSDLAKRLGVNQKTIHSLEVNEVNQKIQLASLQKLADAMDCDFYYAFIPRHTLEDTYTKQAELTAEKHIKRIYNTMALEKQSVVFSKNKIQEIVDDIKEREIIKW